MTEKFNDIKALEFPEFAAVVNNNVVAPSIYLGKVGHPYAMDMAKARALRDWLNRAVPEDEAGGQS